ncbi:MAG: hypothetical protein ACRD4J_00345 [Nitrososphaeraceae archaeon]
MDNSSYVSFGGGGSSLLVTVLVIVFIIALAYFIFIRNLDWLTILRGEGKTLPHYHIAIEYIQDTTSIIDQIRIE